MTQQVRSPLDTILRLDIFSLIMGSCAMSLCLLNDPAVLREANCHADALTNQKLAVPSAIEVPTECRMEHYRLYYSLHSEL